MNRAEARNLLVGDIVEVTQTGLNQGAQGVVIKISTDRFGVPHVYLKPHKCVFRFNGVRDNVNSQHNIEFMYNDLRRQ